MKENLIKKPEDVLNAFYDVVNYIVPDGYEFDTFYTPDDLLNMMLTMMDIYLTSNFTRGLPDFLYVEHMISLIKIFLEKISFSLKFLGINVDNINVDRVEWNDKDLVIILLEKLKEKSKR